MPLDASAIAQQIKVALNQATQPTSAETLGMAQAIVEEITTMGLVSFLPATVEGTAPPTGGPLLNGKASNGLIVGPLGPHLANLMKSKMNKPSITAQLLSMGNAIANCIILGKVNFAENKVTGLCTNTPLNPGAFTGGATDGLISGLDSGKLADDLANPYGGKSPEVIALASAITTYIMGNAAVSFAMPLMTGTCSAGGGPLALGAGSGGTIL